jgi:hypothetical protein
MGVRHIEPVILAGIVVASRRWIVIPATVEKGSTTPARHGRTADLL